MGHFALGRDMRFSARIVLAFAFLSVGACAQTAPPVQLSSFAGTFKAEFHKQTWLVLTLIDSGNTLTGTLMHSIQLSADDEGDITSVGDEMSTDAIANIELHGETLHITTRDEEGNEDHYALTLTGADTADLNPMVAEDVAGPKPFKLKRAVPATTPK